MFVDKCECKESKVNRNSLPVLVNQDEHPGAVRQKSSHGHSSQLKVKVTIIYCSNTFNSRGHSSQLKV